MLKVKGTSDNVESGPSKMTSTIPVYQPYRPGDNAIKAVVGANLFALGATISDLGASEDDIVADFKTRRATDKQ
jgi:hypothetical protein